MGRERNIDLLFHLLVHSLVDSYVCRNQLSCLARLWFVFFFFNEFNYLFLNRGRDREREKQ